MKSISTLVIVAAALGVAASGRAAVSAQTLDNLNAAFQGESNAANRYALFAQKADQEGYPQAARLFRAAARAETIHRDSHKAVILSLGGTVKNFQLDGVTPGTTAENLRAAVKGESYERDTMYPEFLARARQDGAQEAVRTFVQAQKAETEHARLYQAELEQLGRGPATPLYVCTVCGFTTTSLPARNCPSCRESADKYVRID